MENYSELNDLPLSPIMNFVRDERTNERTGASAINFSTELINYLHFGSICSARLRWRWPFRQSALVPIVEGDYTQLAIQRLNEMAPTIEGTTKT